MNLIYHPHPTLSQVAQEVQVINHTKDTLADQMLDIMYRYKGVGLSAPQVGVPTRVVVINPDWRNKDSEIVAYNPVIRWRSEDTAVDYEGCLSLPDVRCLVKRAKSITVEYTDRDGILTIQPYYGIMARIWQHEVDHLQGVLITDREMQ